MINNMRITIADRYKPFTHVPGTSVLLPYSSFCFEIFPALIRVYHLGSVQKILLKEIPLNISGIVEGFTIQQDLEKGCLKVWGKGSEGYFRYRIHAVDGGKAYKIITEKEPTGFSIFSGSQSESTDIIAHVQPENLSFGISKSQDWAMIHRRQKMMEILPFWFRLGQSIPSSGSYKPNSEDAGTLHLLSKAFKGLEEKDSVKLIALLEMLYLTGFEGMLVPRLEDALKQGLKLPSLNPNNSISPLTLLSEGKNLIKRMLIDHSSDNIQILPCLPTEIHCGRMLNIKLEGIGLFDLEWTKKTIRRISFQPEKTAQLTFQFNSNVKTFRLKRQRDGSKHPQICGQPIDFCLGERYLFDNFKR